MDSQAPKNRFWSFVRILISLAIIAVTIWVVFNRQYVLDYITNLTYTPSSEIAEFSNRSGMSSAGRFLFYASEPKLSTGDEFIEECSANNEKTAILGCYSGMKIYLYDIDDPRLDGIKEVTAAHEMLHAAYDRLNASEQKEVSRLVELAYDEVKNERLDELLELYEESEPGHRSNELFAILGTEYDELPTELETVYAEYFDNRSEVVRLATKYQSTFIELADKQQQLVEQLNSLSSEISSLSETYNERVALLSRDVEDFNRRAESGDFDSQFVFDQERSALLSRQANLVTLRSQINSTIARYDELHSQLDEVNLVVNDLNKSINPNLTEAPQL